MVDSPDADQTSAVSELTQTVGMTGDPDNPETMTHAELLRSIEEAQRARYVVEGPLAAGGMGRIDNVIDRTLSRRVVRKCIHDELAKSEKHARMFVREARVTGMLQHPCIVPVHDLGVDERGVLYYTMERVTGQTLAEWLASLASGPLDRSILFDLLDVIVRVCDALGFAHRAGVLHCDVKPANVMVGEFGQVYLMDWGIARLIEEEQRRPPASTVVGSPTCMAPEQARGERMDARTDVFAVGVLLYQIITRRSPFQRASLVQSLASAGECNFPHPDSVPQARGTPVALTRIILKAMAKDPAARYDSVIELRDSLVRFMRGVDVFPRLSFAAGEYIIREGEAGHDAFVVESGSCEVIRTIDGNHQVIRTMGPSEVFGEMSILSPGARTATVRALEPTTLIQITATALEGELDSMKPWAGALVRTLAERFRERDSGGSSDGQ